MADDARSFRAIYEHDPADDRWFVHVEGFDGCHTYGRTRSEAADRITEALAAWLDKEPSEFTLTHA
ncbi:MAG: HicB like antitoxin of bacterial toxin-antitoxin system [Actinomycetota bacterium]|jgi:predicted RNase H-like HicB family nuclease|nr:HicB like antitoxin of bacterial toxin-antitoxin system [Actinomycetota bacterium]